VGSAGAVVLPGATAGGACSSLPTSRLLCLPPYSTATAIYLFCLSRWEDALPRVCLPAAFASRKRRRIFACAATAAVTFHATLPSPSGIAATVLCVPTIYRGGTLSATAAFAAWPLRQRLACAVRIFLFSADILLQYACQRQRRVLRLFISRLPCARQAGRNILPSRRAGRRAGIRCLRATSPRLDYRLCQPCLAAPQPVLPYATVRVPGWTGLIVAYFRLPYVLLPARSSDAVRLRRCAACLAAAPRFLFWFATYPGTLCLVSGSCA